MICGEKKDGKEEGRWPVGDKAEGGDDYNELELILMITADQSGGMGGMMQDLAFAIPGVDEAMGFAEIMK